MIYYRKTLFGCGPKLTAVQLTNDKKLNQAIKTEHNNGLNITK